jgi:hypothetical protein
MKSLELEKDEFPIKWNQWNIVKGQQVNKGDVLGSYFKKNQHLSEWTSTSSGVILELNAREGEYIKESKYLYYVE